MSGQPAQQIDLKEKLVRPSSGQRLNRLKSRPHLGGYQPRTLQRVSVTKWEADADLEQGLHEDDASSVSPCVSSQNLQNRHIFAGSHHH